MIVVEILDIDGHRHDSQHTEARAIDAHINQHWGFGEIGNDGDAYTLDWNFRVTYTPDVGIISASGVLHFDEPLIVEVILDKPKLFQRAAEAITRVFAAPLLVVAHYLQLPPPIDIKYPEAK